LATDRTIPQRPAAGDRLELSVSDLEAMASAIVKRIGAHIATLETLPAAETDVDALAAFAGTLAEPLPQTPTDLDALLDLLFDEAIPRSYNTAGPGYLAYVPGGGLLHSALADLIANAVNRYVGVYVAAPALVQLESNVVRWFCDMVGYPEGAFGYLTSGGSLANLSAIVTARRERLPEDFLSGVIYTSDQAHHSVMRAALLAGFPAANVRVITADEDFRLPVAAVAEAIAADRRAGLQPFLIAASAGTTNSGVVDDLHGLANLAAHERCWLHADAAYGGFFVLTERGRRALSGLERADSITLDPHKGLFLPYGTGALLVRDRTALARAHDVTGDYMPGMQSDPSRVDFCAISPELSRDFRGLRVWLPLKLAGAEAFEAALNEKMDLARWAAGELRDIEGMTVLAEPELSLVAFRLTDPAGGDGNALNQALLDAINAPRRVYLTGTWLKGLFTLRICVLCFRTHGDRLAMCLEDIRAAVNRLGSSSPPPT